MDPSEVSRCGVRCSRPPSKIQQKLSSKVTCSRVVNPAAVRPSRPLRLSDWRTRLNAPAARAKPSNSVPLFGPACALRPRHGPLCAVFLLCPGTRRCGRSFRGVGRSQAPARFFWCRPLHPSRLHIAKGPISNRTLSILERGQVGCDPFPRCAHSRAPLPLRRISNRTNRTKFIRLVRCRISCIGRPTRRGGER